MMTTTIAYNSHFLSPPGILRLAIMRFAASLRHSRDGLHDREKTFTEIMERYSRLVASICLSFAKSKEDFEDPRQESLLNIWKGLSAFRNDSDIST